MRNGLVEIEHAMRSGHHDERNCGRRRAIALLAGGVMLSGCSGGSTGGPTESWLSSRISGMFASATPGVTQPSSPTPSAPDVECPGVDIRTGASTLNIAAKPGQATAGDLRYQLSFGQTARECMVQGDNLSIKVGVQGRIILGPMGGPGVVEVPIRYAVVREGVQPRTVVTKFKRFPVTVAADQTHVQFVDIEDGIAFPLPPETEIRAYVVYVGFDDVGDKNEKKPPKSAKKPTQRQK
jgi:hypothetical protein